MSDNKSKVTKVEPPKRSKSVEEKNYPLQNTIINNNSLIYLFIATSTY